MTNAFIIHGAYGNPQENWFPWLKLELENLGCRVFIPQFPTPEGQSLESWLKVFEDYKQDLDQNSIMVGHSIGCAFVLNVIEKLSTQVKATFLVAGWTGLLRDELDKINQTFVDRQFDWNKVRHNCQKFYVFNSDNDPYVQLSLGETLANNLNTQLIKVIGAGHFNQKAGFKKFDLLLEKIKKEL